MVLVRPCGNLTWTWGIYCTAIPRALLLVRAYRAPHHTHLPLPPPGRSTLTNLCWCSAQASRRTLQSVLVNLFYQQAATAHTATYRWSRACGWTWERGMSSPIRCYSWRGTRTGVCDTPRTAHTRQLRTVLTAAWRSLARRTAALPARPRTSRTTRVLPTATYHCYTMATISFIFQRPLPAFTSSSFVGCRYLPNDTHGAPAQAR